MKDVRRAVNSDPAQWVTSWDVNASRRSAELASDVDSAYRSLTSHIEQHLAASVQAGSRVLDVGCGVGVLTNHLTRLEYSAVGIDPSTESIRLARAEHPKTQYYQMSIEEFTAAPEPPFQAVVANMVLHTASDIDGFFQAAHSLLSADGVLIATLPHPWYYMQQREDVEFDLAKYYDTQLFWLNFRIHGQPPHPHKVPYVHRPIDDYIKGLTRNGFILKEMDEPGQVGVGKPRDIVILRAACETVSGDGSEVRL